MRRYRVWWHDHAVGIFTTHDAAVRAINELFNASIDKGQISLIMRRPEEDVRVPRKTMEREEDIHTEKAGEEGDDIGAVFDGAQSLLAEAGLVLIPGVGPLLVVGPSCRRTNRRNRR